MTKRSWTFFPALLLGLALVLPGCGVRLPALRAPATPGSATAAGPPPVGAPPATSAAPAASSDRSTIPASLLAPAGVSVGQPAPDFALTNLGGQSVRLSDFRGKPVLVNFFATWCGPCKDELPRFQATYQQYRDQDLQVILVDLKESPVDVGAFATKLGLTMPIVVDDRGTVAAGQYRLTNLPTTVFVDANGVVRGVQVGPLTGVALGDSVTALLGGAIPVQASSSAASQSGAGPLCDCP